MVGGEEGARRNGGGKESENEKQIEGEREKSNCSNIAAVIVIALSLRRFIFFHEFHKKSPRDPCAPQRRLNRRKILSDIVGTRSGI